MTDMRRAGPCYTISIPHDSVFVNVGNSYFFKKFSVTRVPRGRGVRAEGLVAAPRTLAHGLDEDGMSTARQPGGRRPSLPAEARLMREALDATVAAQMGGLVSRQEAKMLEGVVARQASLPAARDSKTIDDRATASPARRR